MKMQEKLYKSKDIYELLQISATTLWRWRRSGQFPDPAKINGSSCQFWTESSVNDWIKKNITENNKGE